MDISPIPSDTYLSFFLSKPLWQIWTLFLLGLGRIVPIVVMSPFLGGKILPDSMKIGFGVALTPLFLPMIIVHAGAPVELDMAFIALLAKEIMIGFILGFLASIPFHFAQSAGTLIDHQAGGQSLQVTDPSTQTQATPTGVLYNNVMIVSFFIVGGPLLFFQAVQISYQVIPADHFFSIEFFSHKSPIFLTTIKLMNALLAITLQLCAPSLIGMLLSDLFLGIANRMAPQVQISFLLSSVKAYVGLGLLWLGWWFILKQLDIQGIKWVNLIKDVFEHLKV